MTPTEHLPFEEGIKDGLLIYWHRLKTLLTVMASVGLVLWMIGSFFIPERKGPNPTPLEGPRIHYITLITMSTIVAIILLRRTLSATLNVSLGRSSVSIVSLLLVLIFSGVVASFISHDFDLVTPALSALAVYLFEGLTLIKRGRTDEHREDPSPKRE